MKLLHYALLCWYQVQAGQWPSKHTMKSHQKHPQKQLLLLPLQSLLPTAAAVAARLLCLLQQSRGNKHDLAPGGQLAALTSCHAHQHLLKAANLQASHTSHHAQVSGVVIAS